MLIYYIASIQAKRYTLSITRNENPVKSFIWQINWKYTNNRFWQKFYLWNMFLQTGVGLSKIDIQIIGLNIRYNYYFLAHIKTL